MAWRRRASYLALGLGALYLGLLVAGDRYVEGRVRASLASRLEATFGGDVTVDQVDVSLWRGMAEVRGITLRPGVGGGGAEGLATGEIGRVTLAFARYGALLWSRELAALELQSVRLAMSASALTKLRRPAGRRPLRVGRITVDQLVLDISPSASFPGVLSSTLSLYRVACGSTELRSVVSWLESVQRFEGELSIPLIGGATLSLADRRLSLRGSLLPRAVSIVYAPPPLPPGASDGERVRNILTHIGAGLAQELGGAWLLSQVQALLP